MDYKFYYGIIALFNLRITQILSSGGVSRPDPLRLTSKCTEKVNTVEWLQNMVGVKMGKKEYPFYPSAKYAPAKEALEILRNNYALIMYNTASIGFQLNRLDFWPSDFCLLNFNYPPVQKHIKALNAIMVEEPLVTDGFFKYDGSKIKYPEAKNVMDCRLSYNRKDGKISMLHMYILAGPTYYTYFININQELYFTQLDGYLIREYGNQLRTIVDRLYQHDNDFVIADSRYKNINVQKAFKLLFDEDNAIHATLPFKDQMTLLQNKRKNITPEDICWLIIKYEPSHGFIPKTTTGLELVAHGYPKKDNEYLEIIPGLSYHCRFRYKKLKISTLHELEFHLILSDELFTYFLAGEEYGIYAYWRLTGDYINGVREMYDEALQRLMIDEETDQIFPDDSNFGKEFLEDRAKNLYENLLTRGSKQISNVDRMRTELDLLSIPEPGAALCEAAMPYGPLMRALNLHRMAIAVEIIKKKTVVSYSANPADLKAVNNAPTKIPFIECFFGQNHEYGFPTHVRLIMAPTPYTYFVITKPAKGIDFEFVGLMSFVGPLISKAKIEMLKKTKEYNWFLQQKSAYLEKKEKQGKPTLPVSELEPEKTVKTMRSKSAFPKLLERRSILTPSPSLSQGRNITRSESTFSRVMRRSDVPSTSNAPLKLSPSLFTDTKPGGRPSFNIASSTKVGKALGSSSSFKIGNASSSVSTKGKASAHPTYLWDLLNYIIYETNDAKHRVFFVRNPNQELLEDIFQDGYKVFQKGLSAFSVSAYGKDLHNVCLTIRKEMYERRIPNRSMPLSQILQPPFRMHNHVIRYLTGKRIFDRKAADTINAPVVHCSLEIYPPIPLSREIWLFKSVKYYYILQRGSLGDYLVVKDIIQISREDKSIIYKSINELY